MIGHLFDDVGWYFNGEARVCRRCFAEKERRRWLRVNYSMELEDFEELLVAQDPACAIYARLFDPDLLVPCVDHSHETGKVRGLFSELRVQPAWFAREARKAAFRVVPPTARVWTQRVTNEEPKHGRCSERALTLLAVTGPSSRAALDVAA
ncbi:endonuclease domain-containing protein [Streptomyces sp. NPDC001709]